MATMVDLDEVKEIVKKHGKYIEGLFTELDELAYGKIYTCWCCGKGIYAGQYGWYHVADNAKECRKEGGSFASEYRATPMPKDMED